jgi:hypothetical protein
MSRRMCHEPFPVSPIFKGQSLRCARCRATGIEWKQSWLTTVWFRSLGLSLGNKPHSKSPPAMKMAVRCALWGLQEEMQKSLHLPDFKIRAFVAALDDEQKLAAAPLLEAFLSVCAMISGLFIFSLARCVFLSYRLRSSGTNCTRWCSNRWTPLSTLGGHARSSLHSGLWPFTSRSMM